MATAKVKKRATAPTPKVRSVAEEEISYQIGIRELRQDASRVFALVEGGASFTITNHGRVVGVINPPEKTQLEKWIEEGHITPAKKSIDLRNWKPAQQYEGPNLLALLLKEREEARF
jgi:antitoxin (DNA-binding transcriptional repressor) of toxin-antitoxin stability system